MTPQRNIHLLYAPTNACNLSCNYCYLGKLTSPENLKKDSLTASSTLKYALEKLTKENILAFNLSLHGGEASMVAPEILEDLFSQISKHYRDNFDALNSIGIKKSSPHIKTNLYKLEPLLDLYKKYKASISASIDLPLKLHAKHRLQHNGKPWLEKTLENIRLLSAYPYSKKLSATVSAEHLKNIDDFINDIWYLHNDIGFDMNNFNIMYAFPSDLNDQKKYNHVLDPATSDMQLKLYDELRKRFDKTSLHEGLHRHWFDEFSPSYCTNAKNCGEKFFLLQTNGDIYSCVRGQGLTEFYYGNIFKDTWTCILETAVNKIKSAHQKYGLNSHCSDCNSLQRCNTGCPVVKKNTATSKSYTCDLQKQMYLDYPLTYPVFSTEEAKSYKLHYIQSIHTQQVLETLTENSEPSFLLPNDYNVDRNKLLNLIKEDDILTTLFSNQIFKFQINQDFIDLDSQLLKKNRTAHTLSSKDRIKIHILKKSMSVATKEEDILRNTIYLQLLRDTPVIYGADGRSKQEHLFTHQSFSGVLKDSIELGNTYFEYDLSHLLKSYSEHLKRGVLNNLFITTNALRDYHYNMHRNNAFYHIQTVNLPFQNIEFYYLSENTNEHK